VIAGGQLDHAWGAVIPQVAVTLLAVTSRVVGLSHFKKIASHLNTFCLGLIPARRISPMKIKWNSSLPENIPPRFGALGNLSSLRQSIAVGEKIGTISPALVRARLALLGDMK
jgi:hypothetical protein